MKIENSKKPVVKIRMVEIEKCNKATQTEDIVIISPMSCSVSSEDFPFEFDETYLE
jgi:hypothetical protein